MDDLIWIGSYKELKLDLEYIDNICQIIRRSNFQHKLKVSLLKAIIEDEWT